MRKLLFALLAGCAIPAATLAEEALPPLGDPNRIWAVIKYVGPMPSLLFKAIVAIVVLIIVSVVYYKKVVNHDE